MVKREPSDLMRFINRLKADAEGDDPERARAARDYAASCSDPEAIEDDELERFGDAQVDLVQEVWGDQSGDPPAHIAILTRGRDAVIALLGSMPETSPQRTWMVTQIAKQYALEHRGQADSLPVAMTFTTMAWFRCAEKGSDGELVVSEMRREGLISLTTTPNRRQYGIQLETSRASDSEPLAFKPDRTIVRSYGPEAVRADSILTDGFWRSYAAWTAHTLGELREDEAERLVASYLLEGMSPEDFEKISQTVLRSERLD